MFCKHEWKVLSETTTESRLELSIRAMSEANLNISTLPWQLCDAERTHIQIMVCEKCGEIKRYSEKI